MGYWLEQDEKVTIPEIYRLRYKLIFVNLQMLAVIQFNI